MWFNVFFFFFSSRRRHTRWTGDWSSDVCSSDLDARSRLPRLRGREGPVDRSSTVAHGLVVPRVVAEQMMAHARAQLPNEASGLLGGSLEGGRAATYHPAGDSDAS